LSLSPNEFEDAVATMFSKLGYSIQQTPYVSDHGKDAIAQKDGRKYVIECKRYGKDKSIGRPMLQKLFATMNEEKADGGFFVSTGQFTNTAIDYAKEYNIKLIDVDQLSLMMQQAFPEKNSIDLIKVMCLQCGVTVEFSLRKHEIEKTCIRGHKVINDFTMDDLTPRSISGKKYCDRCGKEMRVIQGRRGKFWGCIGYPICRNTKEFIILFL
jgi:hypothetical protein